MESTADHYKKGTGLLLTLGLKNCRFDISEETHRGKEFHSLDGWGTILR